MKIGLQVPNFTWPGGPTAIGGKLADIAHAADAAGFASLWVMDHFFQIGSRDRAMGLGPAEDDMLEAYTTLSYMAGLTSRVKLGTLVTGVIYRHPGILVKTVTTLDVLSGGRAYLWVMGPLLKGAGAVVFILDYVVRHSPASFLLFAVSDGAMAALTLWALTSGAARE